MSTAAVLQPGRTFRDTSPLLPRVGASRASSLLILLTLSFVVIAPGMMRGRLFPRPTPYVATMSYAADRLRAGQLPLWNPHEHLGEPVTRDGRSAVWYPATLLHVLLPPRHAWHVVAALHLWIAGAGAWMLAGRYGLEPVPRLTCGVAYMLCGPVVLGLEAAQANVLAWLPWAALAVERLSERVTSQRILLASLVLTVQFLGGDLLASAALVTTCFLALLVRAFWIGPRRWAAAIVACVFAIAIAVAASAVQWVPILREWRDNPLMAISNLPRSSPWGAGPFVIDAAAPALFGTIPLVLAGIPIFYGRRPRAVILWGAIALATIMLTIGIEAWIQAAHADALPGLPRPRIFMAGVCLAVAVLAGFGVETVTALVAARAARLRGLLVLLAAGLAAVALAAAGYFLKTRNPLEGGDVILQAARLCVGAALAFAAALVVRSQELPQWRSRGWPWVVLASAELLAFALPGAARGASLRDYADAGSIASFLRSRPEPGRFLAASGLLPDALATWQGLEDAGGAGRPGTRHAAWSAAAGAAGGRGGSEALRVANVRHLIAAAAAPPPPLPWRAAHRSGSLVVYEDPQPYPRAWVTTHAVRFASPTEALAALNGAPPTPRERAVVDDWKLDRADRVLLARRPDFWEHRAARDAPAAAAQVAYASPSPERVRVTVRGGGAGWLVLADSYAPGWRAAIHSQRQPIVAAFGAFRAVAVPAGDVEVEFTYQPPRWREALQASAVGAGGMVLLAGWACARRLRSRVELSAPAR